MNNADWARIDDVSDGDVEFRLLNVGEERLVGDETWTSYKF